MLFANLEQTPLTYPTPNVGCLLDIPTGTPITGLKGETITVGGLHPSQGVVGMGNVGKTALFLYMMGAALSRYKDAEALAYDTETSLKKTRIYNACKAIDNDLVYTPEEVAQNNQIDSADVKRTTVVSITNYYGDTLFDEVKKQLKDRSTQKGVMIDTPFPDRDGKPLKMMPPVIWAIDSLSAFKASTLEKYAGESIGDSARNMENMRDAMAKTQFINELPYVTTKYGLYVIMTAHVGEQHQLDPRQPPKKVLAHLSQKSKIKNTPEKFLFVPHNVFYLYSPSTLVNSSSDKTPMYPRDASEKSSNVQTDLQITSIVSLRNKNGPSGAPFEIIMSQTEGILPTLTEFHYCKTRDRFGLGGNLQHIHMDIYPEVSFSRNTIRAKIKEDNKLVNAIRLTSEILQIADYWPTNGGELVVDMKTLYEGIKAKGYDWNELLETRGYWLPDQYTNPVRFLSGMDLLNMYHGLYVPYWLQKEKKQ